MATRGGSDRRHRRDRRRGCVTGRTSQLPTPAKGPQVYTRIGVRPFINLTGTFTINGGALELPEVRDACHQAADYAVDIDELMEKVGARIAELIGCEGAIVTSGAAAALSHATAACIAGSDPELMQQLPDLTGLKDEVIMPRESRNVYDHAFRSWGARVIEVDTVEAFHAALGPRTAMVAVLGTGEARGPLAAGGDRRGGSQSRRARDRRCCRGTSSPARIRT